MASDPIEQPLDEAVATTAVAKKSNTDLSKLDLTDANTILDASKQLADFIKKRSLSVGIGGRDTSTCVGRPNLPRNNPTVGHHRSDGPKLKRLCPSVPKAGIIAISAGAPCAV